MAQENLKTIMQNFVERVQTRCIMKCKKLIRLRLAHLNYLCQLGVGSTRTCV